MTDQEKLIRDEENAKSPPPSVIEEEITNQLSSRSGDDKFATCILDQESPPSASSVSSEGDNGSLKTTYSNTLLAAKLLLGDMNDSEVQQLQIWCAKELLERKK